MAAVLVATQVGPAWSQSAAMIDLDLRDGVDLRTARYSICLDQQECSIDGLTIVAQRRDEVGGTWMPATIYWDPVDGIGVKDGGQNDEIDFDERIVVRWGQDVPVEKIWLSDLFEGEDARYGSGLTPQIADESEDAEIAQIDLSRDGSVLDSLVVVGNTRLPWEPFNQEVSPQFLEQGDLRRRVVINDDTITLIVPYTGNRGEIVLSMPIGQIDPEKQALFEGVETVDVDLTPILAEFHNAPLFAVGTRNADWIATWLDNRTALDDLYQRAAYERLTSDTSNGEIQATLDNVTYVDTLTFYAPFDASNDFSVAGIVLAK
jgi:hypothetical protein